MGPGGRLVPFFKSVFVYFLATGGGDVPSLAAVAFKCAPVLSLALFVLLHRGLRDQRSVIVFLYVYATEMNVGTSDAVHHN